MFHQNRWDYVYLYRKDASAPVERRHLAVIFERDTLALIEGDIPITREAAPSGTTPETAPTPAPVTPAS